MTHVNADLLISTEELSARQDERDLVIVDCAWDDAAYGRAHIPGALLRPGHPYVKTAEPDSGVGLHLPRVEELAELAASLGIGSNSNVVAYDDWGGLFAARLWWVFRTHGFEGVRVLDGGWQAWVDDGRPISFRPGQTDARRAGPLNLALDHERIATFEELMSPEAADMEILDVRSEEEFEGSRTENARPGHIPGATHLEWSRFLENSDDAQAVRRWRSQVEIESLLDEADVERGKPMVTYCQAAVRAAMGAFTLELAGHSTPRVYDGSMAEWANRTDTPLEVSGAARES